MTQTASLEWKTAMERILCIGLAVFVLVSCSGFLRA